MEEPLVSKQYPVPIPYNSYSFIAKDDSLFTVTPEKTLSSKLLPITQSLKESSFITYGEGKNQRSKVQFDRNVSVYHFNADQTSNEDESFDDDFGHSDSPSFHSLLSENSKEYYDSVSELQHLTNRVDEIGEKVRQNFSESCQANYSCWSSRYNTYSNKANHFQVGSLGSKTPADDSLIITDVHSHVDEQDWEDNNVQNGDNTVSKDQEIIRNLNHESMEGMDGGRKGEDKPGKNGTSYESTDIDEDDTKANKGCLKDQNLGSCSLTLPTMNTTLKISADVEKLRRQTFDSKISQKEKLTDPKLQAKIDGKALKKLNVSETNNFCNLISVDVDEEQLCRKVIDEKVPRARRERSATMEDKISRIPDVMDFYNKEYFVTESLSSSIYLLSPGSPSCPLPVNRQLFKPKLKTAGPERTLDIYKSIRMWEGLP